MRKGERNKKLTNKVYTGNTTKLKVNKETLNFLLVVNKAQQKRIMELAKDSQYYKTKLQEVIIKSYKHPFKTTLNILLGKGIM